MDEGWQRLDERAIPYASTVRWIRIAVEALVFLVVGGLAYADRWLTPSLRLVLVGIFVLLLGLEVVLAFVMPRLEHRHTRYRVDEKGLEIRRGVLWRSLVTVARSRVQHLDVTQGPLERSYGLGRLHVHTAGTHDAVVSLHGIRHETAKALRDDLGAWTAADDGV
jgi:membrane protein YdbS with pleckstrin-like domain